MAAQLIALPAVERLSPRCIRILGGNPGKFTLQGTNTYLIGTGRRRILLDTGEGRPAWLVSLRETLERENATVESAIISHWHPDHVGGIADLQGAFPDVNIYKNNPSIGQLAIADGQTFLTEGATLTASYTPGHTNDHMVFVLREEDAMFTADNVLGQGTAVFEDLTAYLSSLDKMRRLFRGKAYPGHGPVVDDGPAKIAEYIEHRRQREEQVLQVLRSRQNGGGGHDSAIWKAMDIVKVVYTEIPQALHPAACGGVVQVLQKLQADGTVTHDGQDGWRLKESSPSL
jgi:endoribonuclease LACTB2